MAEVLGQTRNVAMIERVKDAPGIISGAGLRLTTRAIKEFDWSAFMTGRVRDFWRPRFAASTLLGLLFVGQGLALQPTSEITQYNCQTWNHQNSLISNVINAVTQTADGYLWFGTSSGLIRFDGKSFKPFDLSGVPGVSNGKVTSLAGARAGGLWVGLENSAFGFFDGHAFSFRGGPDRGTVNMNVRSILESKDGALWIGSQQGVSRLSPEGAYTEGYEPVAGSGRSVVCVQEAADGRIWFGTAHTGVFFWEAGQVKSLPDDTLVSVLNYAVAQDLAGKIWVGTSRGLRCYDAAFQRVEIPLLEDDIRALLVDRHGTLWIGTHGRGLARYQDGHFDFLGRSEGLASAFVNAIAEDAEGSLWVGTRDGVSQLSDVKFPAHVAAENVENIEAWSVGVSRRGGVWTGSMAGLTYLDGKALKTYSTEAGLPKGVVKRSFEASNGDVYLVVGETGGTLAIFSGGRVVATHAAPSMLVGMAEDAHGVVVSAGGSLYRVGPAGLTPYVFIGPEPILGWVLNLEAAQNGGIWVSSVFGLFRVKDGIFETWEKPAELPALRVVSTVEDSDVLWCALPEGIARLKDNKIRLISRDHGLFDKNIFNIVPDDLGNLWVNSSRGIFRVSRQSMNDFADGKIARVQCQAYDGLESVRTTDRTMQEAVACKTPDGRIWFPGPHGVVVIDPAHIPTNAIAPPVHIDRVLADGQERALDAAESVAPGRGELEFHFTALSYIAPQRIKFRYKLEGYDTDWVEAGDRRLAFYTNLKPGLYTFRIKAANADGVWNEQGAARRVQLLPHFYQTTWFYLLSGGALCGILGGVYFWRIQHLNQRQRALQKARDQLEIEVRNRTSELATTNLSLNREIANHERTEGELARERDILRALLDSCPDAIYFKDAQSHFVLVSRSKVAAVLELLPELRERRTALGLAPAETEMDLLNGMTDFDTFQPHDAQLAFEDEQRIVQTGEPMIGKLEQQKYLGGGVRWSLASKMPWRNPEGKIIGTYGISKDVTDLKQAEENLAKLHQQLLVASRQAGMAEVATGVLHNVGNVLNSVNVSATLVTDHVRHTKAGNIAKLAALFAEHRADLGTFLTQNPRGRIIPGYLNTLAANLATENEAIVTELGHLRKNIDHIKEIVAMQQSHARNSGVFETIGVLDMIEDALRMNSGSLARHEVDTLRDYQSRPVVTTDKHKVMQILINIVRNAKFACDESGRLDKQIIVRTTSDERSVKIAIIDNGVGIPAENLTRIFNHGFTTRKEGHGFGLHSGALAAREIGGALHVHSEGPGMGATFTLEIPFKPDAAAA